MKFFSVLLKTSIPKNKTISVITRLYNTAIQGKSMAGVKKGCLIPSKIPVNGFNIMYDWYFSGKDERGYITGVAYMNS